MSTAVVVPAVDVAPAAVPRCAGCREHGVIVLRRESMAEVFLYERWHPNGTLVMVEFGDRWGVRDLEFRERPSPGLLRLVHVCRPHRYECMGSGCGFGARLFAGGTFCEDCRP